MPALARNILRQWLPLALAITLICGLMYAAVQQALRQGANNPQVQMAEDAAAALAAGQLPGSLIPTEQVEMATSLAPYLLVYDGTGHELDGSATLNGRPPVMPGGVFDYVRQHGQDRITWQPEPGVRIAAVAVAYGGGHPGFVVAGRSLREAERQIDNLGLIIAAGWLGTVILALVAVAGCEYLFR